jgi:hypothetical protein
MRKKIKIVLATICLILLLLPLGVYYIHFRNQQISYSTETWGQFGEYLNGTFMPLIALVGVMVTLMLGLISEERNKNNLKIEQQKQRPLLHIGYFDYEDRLSLFMRNKGNGPLIITNYKLLNLQNGETRAGIFETLPATERLFDNYTGNQNNTVLEIGEETTLFLFEQTDEENIEEFGHERDLIREALCQYKIVVNYKDVYDNSMPTYERSLEWFGRNL